MGQFGGMMKQFGTMMGMPEGGDDLMMSGMAQTRELTRKVNAEFKNPNLTTFVCVCIPEFLSLYETERLLQDLAKFHIDVQNIVVNPAKSCSCEHCTAKSKTQQKYLQQMQLLYED